MHSPLQIQQSRPFPFAVVRSAKTAAWLLVLVFGQIRGLAAQDLRIFDLQQYEIDSAQYILFVSLSDIYPLSEHPDSLATPYLGDYPLEAADQFSYFALVGHFRSRFLHATALSENDKLFVYDYQNDLLYTFILKSLTLKALLNPYAGDWPYAQDDYMIGFELPAASIQTKSKSTLHAFASVGKVNPFERGQVKAVVWQKEAATAQPFSPVTTGDAPIAKNYTLAETYTFEVGGMQYVLQNLLSHADQSLTAKRLLVIALNTKAVLYEKLYRESESESFASLEEQWTGKLFKNKPPVVFGFQYASFGCPSINFIGSTEPDLRIHCDNRH